MSRLNIDIDKIVKEVLSRLNGSGLQQQTAVPVGCPAVSRSEQKAARQAGEVRKASEPTVDSKTAPLESTATPENKIPTSRNEFGSENGLLVLRDQVITLKHLEDKLDGITRIQVSKGAIITPAVRDELLARGIEVVYSHAAEAKGRVAFRLWIVSRSYDPRPLINALQNAGIETDWQRSECLVETVETLAAALGENSHLMAGILCGTAAAAICLANRDRRIRAILIQDPMRASEEATQVGANTIVLDFRRYSLYQLRQAIIQFAKHGPYSCPEDLKPYLG